MGGVHDVHGDTFRTAVDCGKVVEMMGIVGDADLAVSNQGGREVSGS